MGSVLDYTRWIKSIEDKRGRPSSLRYTDILTDFVIYVIHKGILWEEIFTLKTLEAFCRYSGYKGASRAIRNLSDYLFNQGRISRPLYKRREKILLPEIYEEYLVYHEQGLQAHNHIMQVRGILTKFHLYLEREKVILSDLTIEQIDNFMAGLKVAQNALRTYLYLLKGFLKYLYLEKRVLRKDLSQMLVGPPLFTQSVLPKFLRPQQVRKLFASLKVSTPTEIRTYAMTHLAYSLGLRPVEISRLTLDDIAFIQGEITIRERKGKNPVVLPIPQEILKAIALYLDKGRPKAKSMNIFLSHQFPYRPASPGVVSFYISRAMKKAGLPSSAYWLRHTYAQNLLTIGRSIYEVKEMLGHQNIQSTMRYLSIHTELMRKVIFDEEL